MTRADERIQERYGKNSFGWSLLMARRLVSAGVRFVSLTYGGWDMHSGITNGMKRQVPDLDQALQAVIDAAR